MPYIKPEIRALLDPDINVVVTKLQRLPADALPGATNYTLTRILTELGGRDYDAFAAMIGIVETVKLELYRRLAAPYENKKLIENGEVYTP